MGSSSRSIVVLVAILALMFVPASPSPCVTGVSGMYAASEEFSMFYEYINYGASYPVPYSTTDLVLRWSGDYHWNFTCWLGFEENESISGSASPELALSAFETIMGEGFCSMLDSYRDLGFPEDAVGENLTVLYSSGSKSVSFGGHSMMGLMPGSWTMFSNLMQSFWYDRTEPLDVDLDISLTSAAGPTETDITPSLTNLEGFKVAAGGVCTTMWPMRILRVNGCSVYDFGIRVVPECIMEFEPGTTTEFEAHTWDWNGVAPGLYVVMVTVVVTNFTILEIPGSSGATNQKPVAEFTVDPPEGNETTEFVFDATRCCDWEDNASDLLIRWDWGGDGEWDTDWSETRMVTHEFESGGRHHVQLEVMDSDGATNRTEVFVIAGATSWTADESLLAAALVISLMVGVGAFVAFRRGHSSGGSG